MKKMKKIMSALLAATMVLSMSVTAFADDEQQFTTMNASQANTITLKKAYTITNDDEANTIVTPEETFYFTLINSGTYAPTVEENSAVTTAPTTGLYIEPLELDEQTNTAEHVVTVHLPAYEEVGKYTYYFEEKASNNAGVECFTGKLKLVVTVVQDTGAATKSLIAAVRVETVAEDGTVSYVKTDTFENVYNAGTVKVKKVVNGNMGDLDKHFKITVTFNAPEGEVFGNEITTNGAALSYADSEGNTNVTTATISEDKKTATAVVYLKNDETIEFQNVPYDVTYTVVEDDYTETDGYKAAKYAYTDNDGNAKTEQAACQNLNVDTETEQVTITNTKEVGVDTGISLDNMPYIMVLALVALGLVGFVSKKRSMEF